MHWDQRSVGSDTQLKTVAYGNGHFLIGGWFGAILQSGAIINLSLTANTATGLLSLSVEGPTGSNYSIQSSTDMNSWSDVTKITSSLSGKIILDGLPVGPGQTFYRAYSQ
jgi:hypothetical protein